MPAAEPSKSSDAAGGRPGQGRRFVWLLAGLIVACALGGKAQFAPAAEPLQAELLEVAPLPGEEPNDQPESDDPADLTSFLQPAPLSANPNEPSAEQARPPVRPSTPTPRAGSNRLSLGGIAYSVGGAQGPQATAPHMIGDLFGGGNGVFKVSQPGFTGNVDLRTRTVNIPLGGAQAIGFTKMSENGSPIPIDRVFYNFSDFTDVPIGTNGVNVNRSLPGFEKTFFNRNASIEVRTPFADTVDPNASIRPAGPGLSAATYRQTLFGDMSVIGKQLLVRRDRFLLSTGLQVTMPTSQSQSLTFPNTYQIFVHNQSTHLMPFVGWWYAPIERVFMQGIVQVDVDTNGNSVTDSTGGNYGRLRDPTYLYVDLNYGYWLLREPERRGLTGLAPLFEVHVNQQVGNPHSVSNPALQQGLLIGQTGALAYQNTNATLVNLTAGLYATFNERTSLTLGYGTPVSDMAGRQFSNEFRAFVNWRFGPSARAAALGPY